MINKIICVWILLLATCNVQANITVGTYNAPPFSMYEDGENIGMATEAVQTLLKKCGIEKYTIINYPLARGLAELHEGRIDIYYPFIIENKEQAAKYTLIGPISKYKISLFVRKDYKSDVNLQAMQHLILGAERGSISNLLLQKHNIHTEQATQAASCLRMVLAERVSACVIGTLPGQYSAALNNLSDKLRFADSGAHADMYVVLGTSLPKELVTKIQDTFEKLKNDNYFDHQQRDYEEKFNVFLKSLS